MIVHVAEPPVSYAGGEFYYGIPNPTPTELRNMLEEVKPADPSVRFEHRLLTGSIAPTLCKLAQDEGVSMIVIGTHGRTGLARILMGSVAEAIMRRASCPVLTSRSNIEKPVPVAGGEA